MSHESRVTSHELARVEAVKLVNNYGGDVVPSDYMKRFCERPTDRPSLVSYVLKPDIVWGDWMGLSVIDLQLDDEHMLEPTSWLKQAHREAWRELGDTGLSLFQAELQIATSSGPRTDIRFDQWRPSMLTPAGQIIERMVA